MIQGSRNKKVLVVDDCVANLTIAKKALDGYYTVVTALSGDRALEMLTRQGLKPSVMLLDMDMPGLNGLETLQKIKEDNRVNNIPVIMTVSRKTGGWSDLVSDDIETQGFMLGAVDFMTKPFSVPIMQRRVYNHIEMTRAQAQLTRYENHMDSIIAKKTNELLELQDAMVSVLLELMDLRNGVGRGSARTIRYLETLIEGLREKGYYADEIDGMDTEQFLDSARLYDIGQVVVPDHILKKSDKLTHHEFDEVKKHTIFGQQAILMAMQKSKVSSFLNHAAVSAISHHERWDGSGYPYGLSQDEIPLQGRLVAVADVYDALISNRPYKSALSTCQAFDVINGEAGRHFDPKIVEIFSERRAEFEKIAASQ